MYPMYSIIASGLGSGFGVDYICVFASIFGMIVLVMVVVGSTIFWLWLYVGAMCVYGVDAGPGLCSGCD